MSINIPVITENVIVRLSGGADSALMLWMICNEWEKKNKKLIVWPVTVIHGVRNWQSYYAQQVYDYIQDNCYGEFKEFNTSFCTNPKQEYVNYQEQLMDNVIKQTNQTTQAFNGVTANPDEEIGLKYWGSSKVFGSKVWNLREHKRDWNTRLEENLIDEGPSRKLIHCEPFRHSHKGHVAELYKKYKLINTLLPLTRSCEGWDYMTKGFTEVCGECWWCMEREWAFNEYIS